MKPVTHKAHLNRFDSALWHFHIAVPSNIADPFIKGKNRRVVCDLNGVQFQCALMPDGNDNYFININKTLRDKLKLKLGDEVNYQLLPDNSEYGLPMPEELDELLQQDEAGSAVFHALTPGKQRTLIYMVITPKSSDIRIRKALCILEHLKATQGKINYRQLNELFKNSR